MSSFDHEYIVARLRQIYNAYRTALMNCKYNAYQLVLFKRWNLGLEVATAIGTSTAVGNWAIWKGSFGWNVWTLIGGLAAVIAVVKPILQLPKDIERYTELHSGYSDLYYGLQKVVLDIQACKTLTLEMDKAFSDAYEHIRRLAPIDDPKPSIKTVRRSFEEVKREVPVEQLWIPAS